MGKKQLLSTIVITLLFLGLSSGYLFTAIQTKKLSQKSPLLNIAQKVKFQKGLKKIMDKVVSEGSFTPAISREYSRFLKDKEKVVRSYNFRMFKDLLSKVLKESLNKAENSEKKYQEKLRKFDLIEIKLSKYQRYLLKILSEAKEKNILVITDLPSDSRKRIEAIQHDMEENDYWSDRAEAISSRIESLNKSILQRQRELRTRRRTSTGRRPKKRSQQPRYYKPATNSMYDAYAAFFGGDS